ncbi:hypothetical protein [Nevskia sp.]|uniref:hypothetical protein n=1 Tax=Nevskia sp. TaxID=1929292 RepID=UPI003F72C4EA
MKSSWIFALIFLCGCTSGCGRKSLELTDVLVQQAGTNESDDARLCKGFSVTNEEAAQFFGKAVRITEEQRHDYIWGWGAPCWIRGAAKLNGLPVKWELGVGGVAEIHLQSGESIAMADPSQKDADAE